MHKPWNYWEEYDTKSLLWKTKTGKCKAAVFQAPSIVITFLNLPFCKTGRGFLARSFAGTILQKSFSSVSILLHWALNVTNPLWVEKRIMDRGKSKAHFDNEDYIYFWTKMFSLIQFIHKSVMDSLKSWENFKAFSVKLF